MRRILMPLGSVEWYAQYNTMSPPIRSLFTSLTVPFLLFNPVDPFSIIIPA